MEVEDPGTHLGKTVPLESPFEDYWHGDCWDR